MNKCDGCRNKGCIEPNYCYLCIRNGEYHDMFEPREPEKEDFVYIPEFSKVCLHGKFNQEQFNMEQTYKATRPQRPPLPSSLEIEKYEFLDDSNHTDFCVKECMRKINDVIQYLYGKDKVE